MQRKEIERIFESYFEKFKKTEGDRSSWSAVWLDMNETGTLELNMTKCPKGLTFKIFIDKKKAAEASGWDNFFETMKNIAEERPGLYDADRIFTEMEFSI